MSLQLPEEPDQYFIDQILLDGTSWDASQVHGYDPNTSPGSDSWFAYGTSLDNVGTYYPSLVVQYSNETSGGQSTYDYMTSSGPGQNRNGSLVATARVQDDEDGYTGDSATHSAVDAETLADAIISQVEAVCARNASGGSSDFQHLGSQRGADTPDDREETPIVRMASCTISYSWLRTP